MLPPPQREAVPEPRPRGPPQPRDPHSPWGCPKAWGYPRRPRGHPRPGDLTTLGEPHGPGDPHRPRDTHRPRGPPQAQRTPRPRDPTGPEDPHGPGDPHRPRDTHRAQRTPTGLEDTHGPRDPHRPGDPHSPRGMPTGLEPTGPRDPHRPREDPTGQGTPTGPKDTHGPGDPTALGTPPPHPHHPESAQVLTLQQATRETHHMDRTTGPNPHLCPRVTTLPPPPRGEAAGETHEPGAPRRLMRVNSPHAQAPHHQAPAGPHCWEQLQQESAFSRKSSSPGEGEVAAHPDSEAHPDGLAAARAAGCGAEPQRPAARPRADPTRTQTGLLPATENTKLLTGSLPQWDVGALGANEKPVTSPQPPPLSQLQYAPSQEQKESTLRFEKQPEFYDHCLRPSPGITLG